MAGGHGSALAASFVDLFRWNCQPLGEKHRNNEANVTAPDSAVLQDGKFMAIRLPLRLPGVPLKWWEVTVSVNDNVGGECFVWHPERRCPSLKLQFKL